MDEAHVFRSLCEANEQLSSPLPPALLLKLLGIEQAHAFQDAQDVAMREFESVVDRFLEEGDVK